MNRQQIEKFIGKIYSSLPVTVRYFTDTSRGSNLGEAWFMSENKPCIALNLSCIRSKLYTRQNNTLIKVCLLHELGHIKNRHRGFNSTQELEAQLFAIRTAKKLKMSRVHKEAIYWLWSWGISEWPVFKEAYDLSLKSKECQKYYKKYGYKIP